MRPKEIPKNEEEIRDQIPHLTRYVPLENVLAMGNQALWSWWIEGGTAPSSLVAMYMAREPSLIRHLLQAFYFLQCGGPSSKQYLFNEIELAIDYGLDPYWRDYVRQHLKDL